MRRDEWLVVDGVLKDFPKINRDRILYEDYLRALAICGSSDIEAAPGWHSVMFEQDRYINVTENKRLKKLQRIVNRIYEGFKVLPEAERRVISLWCFDRQEVDVIRKNLRISRRHAFRLKSSAYSKMLAYCADVHDDVKQWRAASAIEIANCLMPLLQKSREQILFKKVGTRVP